MFWMRLLYLSALRLNSVPQDAVTGFNGIGTHSNPIGPIVTVVPQVGCIWFLTLNGFHIRETTYALKKPFIFGCKVSGINGRKFINKQATYYKVQSLDFTISDLPLLVWGLLTISGYQLPKAVFGKKNRTLGPIVNIPSPDLASPFERFKHCVLGSAVPEDNRMRFWVFKVTDLSNCHHILHTSER